MIAQLQVEINKVDAEKIKPLRHSELRKGQDFSTTSYLKDYLLIAILIKKRFLVLLYL